MNKKLSICVTVKDRSRVETDEGILNLFPNCISSLADVLHLTDDVELVIADWQSTDWPVKEWIEDHILHAPIQLLNIKRKGFSKGFGLNTAAKYATGDVLFFMDADMLIKDRRVIEDGINYITQGKVYFPIPFYYLDAEHSSGTFEKGVGNVFISKTVFNEVGGFPEYEKWGFEDLDFYDTVKKVRNIVVQKEVRLQHQWHPQSHVWKNRKTEDKPEAEKVVEKRQKHYKKKAKTEEEDIVEALRKKIKAQTTQPKFNDDDLIGRDMPRIGVR